MERDVCDCKWLSLRACKSGFQEMLECRIFQYHWQVTEAEERAPQRGCTHQTHTSPACPPTQAIPHESQAFVPATGCFSCSPPGTELPYLEHLFYLSDGCNGSSVPFIERNVNYFQNANQVADEELYCSTISFNYSLNCCTEQLIEDAVKYKCVYLAQRCTFRLPGKKSSGKFRNPRDTDD